VISALVGLGLWIGAIVIVGARYSTPADSSPTTTAAVIGGAVFFGCLFVAVGVNTARSKHGATPELYERLALTPVPRDALRAMGRRARMIGYGYASFGAIVTALMLAAIAVGDTERARPIMMAMMVAIGLWLVLMVFTLRQVATMSAVAFAPLGLVLTGLPRIHTSFIADRSWTSGAVTYAGTRHGRPVTILQNAKGAATLVGVDRTPDVLPSTPSDFAALTGETITSWRHVEVACESGTVAVLRTGRAPSKWMLHDLLLAEILAAR
jgi:hypothetical protein